MIELKNIVNVIKMQRNNFKMNSSKKKIFILILIINSFVLYLLEGIVFNPLIIWVLLPIYIGYSIVAKAWKTKSRKKLWEGYTFLIVSLSFSYLYHLAWFFDWDGSKTGGSTAALIFLWGPVWSIFWGYIGYFFASFVKEKLKGTVSTLKTT